MLDGNHRSMHLIYFDEVKDDSLNQKYFWVGGIAVNAIDVQRLEDQVSEISERHFSTPCFGTSTEFHAVEIYHRKKNFKTWKDPTKRIKLIGELLKTLDNEAVKKIYVKVDREYFNNRFSSKRIDEMAFMLFCEKAEALMKQEKDIGMLIGDRESNSIATCYAESLSNWRASRTEYQLGTEIRCLIDTVHFTESHLSRLLQLADIHIWCRQFLSSNSTAKDDIPKLMLDEIRHCGNALFAKGHKEYPLGC